jgi:hypothetical protein
MKTSIILAAALSGLATVPQTASAGHNDKTWIAIGSFLGGVLVGSNIERHSSPPPVVYSPPPPCAPAPSVVIVERPRYYSPPAPSGYWKTVQTRVYVPERLTITTDRYGRQTRVCQPAYYTYETQRVWVDTTPVCREERIERPDRGRSYEGRRDHDDRGYGSYRPDERTDNFVASDEARPRYRF